MFIVDWLPEAEQELAAIWNDSDDRASVAAAADEIDRALTTHPLAVGESRDRNIRIAFEPPLAVVYKVFGSTNRVQVHAIWRWPK